MRSRWYLRSSHAALLLLLIGSGGAAHAQGGRVWVDPPANLNAPAKPAEPPAVPAAPSAPPQAVPQAPQQQAAPTPQPAEPAVRSAQPERVSPAPQPPAQSAETPKTSPPAAPPAPAPTVAQPRHEPESQLAASERTARDLAVRYLASWSEPNQEALSEAGDFYGDRVVFHGRTISARRLVREKSRFARRWPERNYRPQENTMKVACEPTGLVCTVHTMFDFMAANPRRGRRTEGVGALQLVVSFASNQPIITAENSVVLNQGRDRRNLAQEGSSHD